MQATANDLPPMTLDLGIFLALACAFVANLGFFYKYKGANAVPKVEVLHPIRSAIGLYSSKWFCLGMLIATASWGLHVAALSLAPMSVVQVALAAGVVFIAVMADRFFGFEVGKRQWVGLFLTAAGLVLLGVTLPAMHGAHSHFSNVGMISFEAGLFFLGGLLIMGPRMGGPVEHHGVMLAAASGILFGVSDASIKALTGITGAHGCTGLITSPWLAVAIMPPSSPSTPPPKASRTARPSPSSLSPARPPTSPGSPAGSSCSATRWPAARSA